MFVQYSLLQGTNRTKNGKFEMMESETSLIEGSNKEATIYYDYYKILSHSNYDLGRSIEEFTLKFIDENKEIERTVDYIPHQMEEVLKFIDECVGTFYLYFNYGKSEKENVLPYCRHAVEEFIFNKVYFVLYDLYNFKFRKENQAFVEQLIKIKQNCSLNYIMDFSEVKQIFRGNLGSNFVPYKSTINCINKIKNEISPKDKLDALMKASLELRNCILDITKGKVELNGMDDEFPLFVYMCTQIEIENIFTELNLVDHYLKYSKSVDKESKVLTNLMMAVQFIVSSWEFKKNV